MAKHEVCEQCNGFSPVPTTYGHSDVPKLLAIIEKLKEQQRKMYYPSDVWDAGGQLIYDKELDAIVGHP